MRRYEKYKDSGIEWIGDVPETWERNRIKFTLSHSFTGIWGNDAKGNEDDIYCYRVADFNYEYGGLSMEKLTIRNIDKLIYENKCVKFGDVLIEKSGGGDSSPVGRAILVNFDKNATCSNFIQCVRCNEKLVNNRILYYFLFFIYGQGINTLFFNQTTGIQNLKINDYLGNDIYLPPLSEQRAIAAYLDRRTEQIDGIIAKREKQIELLNEMKTALISQAVTKGLDPNAKMKNSGIEWIGEVPETWEVGNFRYFINILTDYTSNGSFGDLAKNVTYLAEPNYSRLIRLTDLRENLNNDNGVWVNKHAHEYLSNSELFGGELLLANVGAYAGLACLMPYINRRATLAPNMFLIKLGPKLINSYALYLLLSKSWFDYLQTIALSSAQPKLNKDNVRNTPIIVPPLSEQRAIAAYLDRETARIDARVAKHRKQIELLKEYKTTLISEVVTGKVKVTD